MEFLKFSFSANAHFFEEEIHQQNTQFGATYALEFPWTVLYCLFIYLQNWNPFEQFTTVVPKL